MHLSSSPNPSARMLAEPPAFSLTSVQKVYYSKTRVVRAIGSVTFDIPVGSFVTIIGPSGCGKSTLLALLLGMSSPTDGIVRRLGSPIRGLVRDVGYVPQQDNLLPWRTVEANVGLGLELRKVGRAQSQERVAELLEIVGLTAFKTAYPRELSGGMRKRASLARALAYRASAVIMDEPFGALDAQMKETLQRELVGLWEAQGWTAVFVTHDLEEAILLSDYVVVLTGPPSSVHSIEPVRLPRPRNIATDRFEPEFQALYSRLRQALETPSREVVS